MNCWVIAVACSVMHFLILGTTRLSPLLFVASIERYKTNRAKASFPFVLGYIIRALSGPLIGIAGRKFGLRAIVLFGSTLCFIGIGACYFAEDIIAVSILWGGLYGFGIGFGISLLPIVLDRTFEDKNKTKANGIALGGGCLGGIVIPPIVQAAIREYGLSGSFLIISGLVLHCVPTSLLLLFSNLKKNDSQKKESHLNVALNSGENCEQKECEQDETDGIAKEQDKTRESIFKPLRIFLDPTFILIMTTQSVFAFYCMVVWTIIIDVSRDKGVDENKEIYCMMILPLSDMIGRVGLGWVTDGGYLSKSNFSVISFLLLSLISVLFVFVHGFELVMLVIFLFGCASGGIMPVLPGVICEFMSARNKVMAMSCRMLLTAPLSFAASPLIGHFREYHGSYDGIFYVLFGISLLCSGMSALIPRFSQKSKSKYEVEEN